ncbi:MAG: S-layer homology domain-containing protein [Clostridia bacterium]|nr:S-layer homology domain-containing protein [Clostridia bacterium]
MKKRIFALFLTLLMSLTSLGAVTAYAENETETAPAEEVVIKPLDTDAFNALYAMGFVGDELKGADKNAYITRAQFIGYLFKLAGYTVNEHKTDDIPFVDVSTKTPYYNEICTMYELGRVNGTEPGMFSPDNHVTYAQACKLIIDVLGYRNYAEIKYGEYPEGYIMMAGELEINEGVNNVLWNSELTAENAVQMLYNAGGAEIFKFAGTDANGNPKYETDGTDLFASNDIYYAEGTMESNGICSIKDDNATLGVFIISGKKYAAADVDLSNLVGCAVKYFYRDDKVSQKLLWATSDTRFVEVIDLKAEELAVNSGEYTMTNVVYYEPNGKLESVKINPLADVIYNNTRCGIPTIDDMKPMTGTIRLIDNNDDELYDVVIVNEYDNMFVTHIVEEKEQIFAKYNKAVYFDDYEEVVIIKDGKETTINDIDNKSIISFIVDKDNKKLYLYPVNETYKTTLKKSETYRGRTVYEFDSGKYRMSNAYKAIVDNPEEYAVVPQIGKTYNIWLDIFGEVAEVQETAGNLQYALLMSVRVGEAYEDCEAYTRLLLPDGNKVTGAINKKVLVNGVKKTAREFLADTHLTDENGEFMVQVVQVAFDDEGDLKKIDFASDTSSMVEMVNGQEVPLFPYGFDISAFSRDYRASESNVRNQDSYVLVANKYLVTDNTLIFGKWHDMDSSEPYEVVAKGTVGSGTYLKDIYDINEKLEIGAMYREGLYVRGSWQAAPLLVDTIEYVYSDDQEVKQITGYMNGTQVSYVEEEPGVIPETIVHGDLIRVSVKNKKLNKVFMTLSYEDIKNKNTQVLHNPDGNGEAWNGEKASVFAPLYRMDANSTTIMTPADWQASVGELLTSPKGSSSLRLTIFDVKNDEIYAGDFYEMYNRYTILANTKVSEETEKVMVFMRMRYVTTSEIIVMVY